MADDQITVKIAADASGVKPALDQARSAMLSFGTGANSAQAQLAILKDGLRQTAGEAVAARTAFATLSPAAAQLKPALDGAGGSAGQTKTALRSLISEVGAVGTSLIEGADPLAVFAQHGLQVTAAIAGMVRGGAGIVAFLGGPWGLALTTAVGLLGALWAKYNEAGEATRKHDEAAANLTGEIRDLNGQTDREIQSTQQAAQAHVAKAEALERETRSIAANMRAQLNAAEADERFKQRGADAALAAGGDPDAVGIMQIMAGWAGQKAGSLRDRYGEDLERILSAQDAQRMARIPVIQEQVRRATDATAAAYGRFSDAVDQLNTKMRIGLTNEHAYAEEYRRLSSIRDATLRGIAQRDSAQAPRPPRPAAAVAPHPPKKAAASDPSDGEETNFKASQDRIAQIAQKAAEESRQIDAQNAEAFRQRQLDNLAREESEAKFRVDLGQKTNDQLLADQAQFEEKRYSLQVAPLADERDRVEKDGSDRVRLNALNIQIEAAKEQHQQKMTAIQRQRVLERTQIERQAVASTVSLWSQNIAKLATLQQGFGATLRNIYGGMVDIVSTALSQMLQKWIKAELSKTAAALAGSGQRVATETTAGAATTSISALSAIKQIAHSAAVAAARVYASIAQIPIVGPILAPAAAAAALFGVIKLGQSIFSARDGAGTVPYDDAPFLLHRNEMVLPASLATPLRAMLQGGTAANGNAPFAADDGGGHSFHYNDYTERGQSDAQIMAKRMVFAKAMKQAYREGAFAGTPLTF